MTSVHTDVFKSVLSCIKEFKNEATFIFKDKDVSIVFVDNNNILVVNSLIKKVNEENSEKYLNLNGINKDEISLDLNKLFLVLKMTKNGLISINNEESFLKIKIKENKKTINTKLDLLTIENFSLNIEQVRKSTHSFNILFSDLVKIIKDMSNFGTNCKITITTDKIIFSTVGINGGSYSCDVDDAEIIETDGTEISESFDIDYLLKIIKSNNVNGKINISMSKQFLICIKLTYEDESYIEFFMAPKED